jgi:hypothetical protein
MKNKEHEIDPLSAFKIITEMAVNGNLSRFFGGSSQSQQKSPYENLKNGFELRPIEMKDSEGNSVENRESYSHLFRNGVQIGSKVFRKGGLSNGFRDGYCDLILYTQKEPHTQKRHGFDFGIHVIINESGDIVLSGEGITSYPHHCGGNLGKLKDCYYNLITKEPIIECSSSEHIDGKTHIFVTHKYDWYSKIVKMPLGVYQINKMTCEITKIDEVK